MAQGRPRAEGSEAEDVAWFPSMTVPTEREFTAAQWQ